jgi:hypothetical protein
VAATIGDASIETARFPAAALVEGMRGRTVVDAYCDGEGYDDVHLVLDDGTRLWIDVDVDRNVVVEASGGGRLELGPRGRLVVAIKRPE